jgi:hypothetical protein
MVDCAGLGKQVAVFRCVISCSMASSKKGAIPGCHTRAPLRRSLGFGACIAMARKVCIACAVQTEGALLIGKVLHQRLTLSQ